MGAIDDTRKVLQDFLAHELRAIAVRIEALEKQVGGGEKLTDDRFVALQKQIEELAAKSEARSDALDRKIDARGDALDKRLADNERRTEQRFDVMQSSMEKKFDESERRAERRHEDLLAVMRSVLEYAALNQRITRLEAERETSHQ